MQGQTLTLDSPVHNQVFQRDSHDSAEITVTGTYTGDVQAVEARLEGARQEPGEWTVLENGSGEFRGSFARVPVGGPYVVRARLVHSDGVRSRPVKAGSLLVGDLWVLAGQSNMDGCGKLVFLEPPSRMVHAFTYDETWGMARDPLCVLNESIDPVHWSTGDTRERRKLVRQYREFGQTGAGLGVRFGKDLHAATGVPVGLIVCSHGGTSMAQWSPTLKDEGGRSLYGSMLRRVQAAGGRVAGCLWYQGESDALGPDAGKKYASDFRNFVACVQQDLGDPDLPFLYVQLAPFFTDDPAAGEGWNRVQTAQLQAEQETPNSAMAVAILSTLSDAIHIDSLSQRKLGAQLAALARRVRFGDKNVLSGPRLAKVWFEGEDRRRLRLSFDGVHRYLAPGKGVQGFTLESRGGPVPIVKCYVDNAAESVVCIDLAAPAPKSCVLWHGRGTNPACCLADSEGFAVPVFGPIRV